MNLKKRYTHIFFDLDNTLWDFNANACSAMHTTFKGFERQFKDVSFRLFFYEYSANNERLWKEYRLGRMHKKDLVRLRFQQTFEKLQIKGIDPLEMNELYLDEMPRQTRLIEGALHTLETLKNTGYKLFVITNGFTQVQYLKMENAGIHHYFSKIFTSEDVKVPKPSAGIFRYALQSANARKVNSLMVGDDFEADILGALRYGVDAAYLPPSVELKNINTQAPVRPFQKYYLLTRLSDLLRLHHL